jgi:hypothetical protein
MFFLMGSATKTTKPVFSKAEVADRQRFLLEKNLGIQPDQVNQDGYLYDLAVTTPRVWN